jgi:stalled ribosome rescue protein Dom34
MRIQVDIKKIKTMLQLKDEIKNNNKFYKRTKKKIINQNNEDQIEKYNTINLKLNDKIQNHKNFNEMAKKKIKE